MSIDNIRAFINDDLIKTDAILHECIDSQVSLIEKLSSHIIESGGKRLRPILVLLTAKLFHYSGEMHCQLAAVIELIHTATLLHDDVVDASTLRRGKETANHIWGNQASVLVGDYIYSRAFELVVQAKSLQIMELLARASNLIAEGEVMQLQNRHRIDVTEAEYLEVILRKTATLFEIAPQLSAIIANQNQDVIHSVGQFGMNLGMAFQLIDDAFDYGASSENIGKNIGDDLAEGKLTLPLIYALKNGSSEQKKMIEESIKFGEIKNLSMIQETIHATNAIKYTYDCANAYAKKAKEYLNDFPENSALKYLIEIADYAVSRTS